MVVRRGAQRDRARRVEADLDLVRRREPGAGGLAIGRHAAAAKFSLFQGSLPPGVEGRPFGNLQRLVEHALEVAAVVLVAAGDAVRKAVLGDEVAPAQLGRVDADLEGGLLYQALQR